MHSKIVFSLIALTVLAAPVAANDNPTSQTNDPRQLVQLPPPMRQHMLRNMRDHLQAISEIQQALSSGHFDTAADIAENRLGMSSLTTHGASHLASFMPEEMQNIGTAMHRSASQFAVIAQQSAVDGDFQSAIAGLAKVTQQCVTCHAAYRVH